MVTDRPIRFYFLLWTGAALALAGVIAAKPVYHWYAHRRALQIVAEVETKDFPAGDWQSVNRKLTVAHGLAAQAPEVLRLSARFLAAAGSEDVLQYYSMLMDTGKATLADRLDYARQALRYNRPDVSRNQVKQILTESPLNLDALLLGIQALERLGRTHDALRLAESTLQSYPTSDEATFSVGLLRLGDGDETKRAAGRRLLWELAVSASQLKTPAVERLAAERQLAPAEIRILAKSMESLTNRTLMQELTLYDLQSRLAPAEERGGFASMAIQRLGSAPTAIERIQVADWLLEHGAPKRVMEVLDQALCRQNEAAAQRWIQSRANADEWGEVSGLIDDMSLPLSAETRNCYRAVMDARAGNTNGVTSHLQMAVGGLKSNPSQIYLVADYAEKLRQPKLAAAAYEKLLPYPLHAPRAAREILRLLAGSDDVKHLLGTLHRLRQFQPDNQEIADSISWWELITRQHVDDNAKAAADRLSKVPNNDRFRLTQALAHLRQNNPDSALTMLENRYPDRTNMPTRARLLYVAALGASGQRQTAERLASVLNISVLKPEEIELIRSWRTVPQK